MSLVKTNSPHEREYVDIANRILTLLDEYRYQRHEREPYPDFSKTRLYLGHRERVALNICEHCIPFKQEPGKGAEISGFVVFFVQAESHIALVEVQN